MNITFGYMKDVIAFFVFFLALVILLAVRKPFSQIWLQRFLTIAVCVDGVYSLFPFLHNSQIFDPDMRLWVLYHIIGAVLIACLLVYSLKHDSVFVQTRESPDASHVNSSPA